MWHIEARRPAGNDTMIDSLAVKSAVSHAAPQAIPSLLAAFSSGLLFAAQAVEPVASTTTESNFLVMLASILASTGVVGYAVRRFVDAQIKRGEDQRKAEQEERAAERAEQREEHIRLSTHYETQIKHWQERYAALEERHDRTYALLVEMVGRKDAA